MESKGNLSTLSFIYQQCCIHSSGNNTIPLKKLVPLLEGQTLEVVTRMVLHRALGNIYRSAADWHSATSHFKMAIQIAKNSGHDIMAMECRAELGRAYRSSGCHSKALKRQKKLLDFALKRGDTFNVAMACGYMGFTYYSMGEEYYDEAVKHLYCKLELCKTKLNDLAGYRWCLNNLGKVYLGLKNYEPCMKLFRESAEIAKQQGNTLGLGTAYGNLGSACRAVDKHAEAVTYHQLYLEIAEKNSDTGGVAIMERELILDHLYLYKKENDKGKKTSFLMEARKYAFKALKTSLEVRSRLSKKDDILKIGNFEHNQAKIFSLLLFIVIEQGLHEAGLLLSELGRAHALADRVTDKLKVDSSFLVQVLDMIGDDNQIVAAPLSSLLQRVGRVISGLKSHIIVYSVLENPLSEGDSKETLLYIWHVHQPPSNCEAFQVRVNFRKSVIKLAELEEDFSEYIFGLTREVKLANLQLVDQPHEHANKTQISRDIVDARRKNVRPKIVPTRKGTLEELYEVLVEPMSHHLLSCHQKPVRLIIIPHGFLFNVPFCALKSQGTYLVEKCVLCLSPSLYMLDIGLQREKGWCGLPAKDEVKLLAVGNPKMPTDDIDQLPGAELEVQSISSHFRTTTVLCGEAATKKAVTESLPEYSVIHLASHAIAGTSLNDLTELQDNSTDIGDYSAKGVIILAKSDSECSGELKSSEIENLHLNNCELLVLSCCATARGKITGDGILGLSRSWMCAGVMKMLVTLWRIQDSSTAELMKHFYQHYISSRDAPAALQAGMLALIQQQYRIEQWAPFCCIGTTYGINSSPTLS